MTETITVRWRLGDGPVLVAGCHPDAEGYLSGLGGARGRCLGWGAGHPAVLESADPGADGDEALVRRACLVVLLDPAPAESQRLWALAERTRVPVWVPAHPALGSMEIPGFGASVAEEGQLPPRQRTETEGRVDRTIARTRGVGDVSLVGAGPGAADLITVRGLQALREADVVIYDRLVAAALLEEVPVHCERVFVGKRRRDHPVPQGEINELLLRHAGAGRRVVRLKGGDPFIFGRGGEEIEHLRDAGIPFRVIPGITAASGCAAFAGIPLTHRDHAQSCTFVTGHRREGALDLDFRGLVREGQTLVFYMGLHSLEDVCNGLMNEGLSPETPAALVQQGTTRAQQVVVGTVRSLPAEVARAGVTAPTLTIIGEVVRLREQLSWFRSAGGTMEWAGPAAP